MQTHFTYDAFLLWWGTFFWPFVRIGALLAVFPVLSSRSVSTRIKLLIAIVMTIAVMPSVVLNHPIDPFTNQGVVMALTQAGIGLAMGLVFVIVFQAVTMAGQMLANAMGLGFASMVDPSTGVSAPVVSQFFTIIVSLFFVGMDGHLLVIRMLVDSFHTMPIDGHFLSTQSLKALVWWGAQIFAWGTIIALPAMTALLMANIALGVISRAAPTLNVFSIGFVITILGGFALLWWLLPLLAEQFRWFMHEALLFVQAMRLSS